MDTKFKLLKSKSKLPDGSNYWNCCPLQNQYLPKEECEEGRPDLDKSKKIHTEPRCPWWINSKKHNYCFWTYVKDNSNSLGEMPEILQSDLAKLFGWSNTKAHFMLKEALENLVEILKEYNLDVELDDLIDEFQISDFTNIGYKNDSIDDC